MTAEAGAALVDGRLLGRPRSYGGNSQEWNAFKFVFKAYVGVIAPPIPTAMDRMEPMMDPVQNSSLPEADKNIARNLSFLLAQVLSGPPLQLMMNIREQNGLEAWRLLVRSELPVTGANRIAAMQAILQYKFSPGFDRLEEELRTFEGLVKTYRAIFGEEMSDSITQAIIKSQMPAEIRPHLELRTFARTAEITSLMSSLYKMTNNVGAKEIGLIESVQEDSEMGWLFMVANSMTIEQLSMDGAHSLVVDSGAHVHVCPKSYATHATLQSLPARWRGLDLRSASGKMLKVWGMLRSGLQRVGSAREGLHCEDSVCCL